MLFTRYERGSLLITPNQQVTQWGTVFGDEVLAAADLSTGAVAKVEAPCR